MGWAIFAGYWIALGTLRAANYSVILDGYSGWLAVASGYSDAAGWAVVSVVSCWIAFQIPSERIGWAATSAVVLISSIALVGLRLIVLLPVSRPTRELLLYLPSQVLVAAAMICAAFAIRFFYQYRRGEVSASRRASQLATAELSLLRMQLHPHFLFNALNSVSSLMYRDVAAAREMLRQIRELLVRASSRPPSETSTLEEELDLLNVYLRVEKARFREHLSVSFHVQPEALQSRIPSLLLQPLVENAIRHGIAPVGTGQIRIIGRVVRSCLEVEVVDDGAGLPPGWTQADAGVGLTNSWARLREAYGRAAQLTLAPVASGGTRVLVRVPANLRAASPDPVPSRGGAVTSYPLAVSPALRWVAALAVVWLFYSIAVTGTVLLTNRLVGGSAAPLRTYLYSGVPNLAWIPLSVLGLLLVQRMPVAGPSWRRNLVLNFAAVLALVALYCGFLSQYLNWLPRDAPLSFGRIFATNFFGWTIVCTNLFGVFHAAFFYGRVRHSELAEERLRAELAEAELRLHHHQLPREEVLHAIEGIDEAIQCDVERADRLLSDFGEVLRNALQQWPSAAPSAIRGHGS